MHGLYQSPNILVRLAVEMSPCQGLGRLNAFAKASSTISAPARPAQRSTLWRVCGHEGDFKAEGLNYTLEGCAMVVVMKALGRSFILTCSQLLLAEKHLLPSTAARPIPPPYQPATPSPRMPQPSHFNKPAI